MAHNFQYSILRVVVGQVCEAVGYNSITQQSLEILVDLLRDYIVRLGSFSTQLCHLNSRVEPTIYDVLRTFDLCGVSIPELQDHITNVEIPPIPLKIHPEYPAKAVNRIQRHLLIDDLLEATKNKANAPDPTTANPDEIDQQDSTPSSTLMRDTFADVLNNFKDVVPISADKRVRPPSPRSVSTVIKIKKTASPLPDENKDNHLHNQATTSRPKTLAERKALPFDLDTKSFLKISKRQTGEKKRGRKSLKETKEREKEDLRALKKKMASKTVMKAVKLSKKEKRSKDKSKKIKKSSLNLSPRHSPLPADTPIKIGKKRGRKPKKDKLLAEESVTPQKKVGRMKSGKKLKMDKRGKKMKDKMKVKLDKQRYKDESKVDEDTITKSGLNITPGETVQAIDVPPKKIEKKRGRKSKKELEALALAQAEQKALLAKNEFEEEKQKVLEMEQERRLVIEREELERAKREEEKEREMEEEREKERVLERQREQLDWERKQEEKERERQKEIEREAEAEAEREKEKEKEREKTKTKDKVKEKVDTGFAGEVGKKKKKAGKAGRKKKSQCIIITETVDTEDATRSDEKEWICPGCGHADDGSLMLECETCKNWYHFRCTVLFEAPAEDEDWICDPCLNEAAVKLRQSREKAKEVKISKDRRDSKENKERSKDPKPSTSKMSTEIVQESTDSDDVPCPVCDKPYDGSLMLQCEDPDCAKWFHGSCVNIYVEPSESDPWFCKKCVEKQQLYLNTAYDKRKRRK